MGKVFDGIDERLERWIAAQPMFFVGIDYQREKNEVSIDGLPAVDLRLPVTE
jgi:hypothetical protein